MTTTATSTKPFITAEQILEHWQGHRNLTRRVIEAFPEKELFEFSIGGMRPFAKLAVELISIGGPGTKGIVENQMEAYDEEKFNPTTKEELLKNGMRKRKPSTGISPKFQKSVSRKISTCSDNTSSRCTRTFYILSTMKYTTADRVILT